MTLISLTWFRIHTFCFDFTSSVSNSEILFRIHTYVFDFPILIWVPWKTGQVEPTYILSSKILLEFYTRMPTCFIHKAMAECLASALLQSLKIIVLSTGMLACIHPPAEHTRNTVILGRAEQHAHLTSSFEKNLLVRYKHLFLSLNVHKKKHQSDERDLVCALRYCAEIIRWSQHTEQICLSPPVPCEVQQDIMQTANEAHRLSGRVPFVPCRWAHTQSTEHDITQKSLRRSPHTKLSGTSYHQQQTKYETIWHNLICTVHRRAETTRRAWHHAQMSL